MPTEVPDFLLVHTAVIEPYIAWGEYGPAAAQKCFWEERMAGGGVTGTERRAQHTVYLKPGVTCPAGSRVTHRDGRKGYASAVVNYDGGGLPTPDHLEVAVDLADAYGPAFGETVVIVRREARRDQTGSTRYRNREVPVPDTAVRMLSSSETPVGTRVETTADTVEVVFPPATDIRSGDAMRVRGLLYDVDGVPEDVASSQSTARPGVKVIGKRRQL